MTHRTRQIPVAEHKTTVPTNSAIRLYQPCPSVIICFQPRVYASSAAFHLIYVTWLRLGCIQFGETMIETRQCRRLPSSALSGRHYHRHDQEDYREQDQSCGQYHPRPAHLYVLLSDQNTAKNLRLIRACADGIGHAECDPIHGGWEALRSEHCPSWIISGS
jgi:hypothetical protein